MMEIICTLICIIGKSNKNTQNRHPDRHPTVSKMLMMTTVRANTNNNDDDGGGGEGCDDVLSEW